MSAEMKCPACNGSHFTLLKARRYISANSSSTIGPGLIAVSDEWAPEEGSSVIACLCDRLLEVPRSREYRSNALKQSLGRARSHREFRDQRLLAWTAELPDACLK
jgi:hypothetical protein